jgi:amino-acid N-acetyltransferase
VGSLPKFTIRAAKPEEGASIRRLILASRLNPAALDWRRFVVAEDQSGAFIGCGQVKPHRDGSQELASVAVEQAWRGRGVGTAIAEHLMQRAGPPLWLMCRSGLAPLYRRLGFREVGPEEDQPPYFKRVRRLATAFEMFSRSGEHLAVMVWEKA